MLKIKNNFRFLHCILAYLVSFYSASRGGSFGVYPIRIRPLTCVLRTLCIILYKVWHTLDHNIIEASLNTAFSAQTYLDECSGPELCTCTHCECTVMYIHKIAIGMSESESDRKTGTRMSESESDRKTGTRMSESEPDRKTGTRMSESEPDRKTGTRMSESEPDSKTGTRMSEI